MDAVGGHLECGEAAADLAADDEGDAGGIADAQVARELQVAGVGGQEQIGLASSEGEEAYDHERHQSAGGARFGFSFGHGMWDGAQGTECAPLRQRSGRRTVIRVLPRAARPPGAKSGPQPPGFALQ